MWKKALVTLAVIVTAVVMVPTAAHATTCEMAGCDGQDMVASGCGIGSVVERSAALDNGNHSIQLVFSAECQTAWAWTTSNLSKQIEIRSYYPGGGYRTTYGATTNANFHYTPMAYDAGSYTAKACEYVPMTVNGWVCTGLF